MNTKPRTIDAIPHDGIIRNFCAIGTSKKKIVGNQINRVCITGIQYSRGNIASSLRVAIQNHASAMVYAGSHARANVIYTNESAATVERNVPEVGTLIAVSATASIKEATAKIKGVSKQANNDVRSASGMSR